MKQVYHGFDRPKFTHIGRKSNSVTIQKTKPVSTISEAQIPHQPYEATDGSILAWQRKVPVQSLRICINYPV